MIQVSQLIYGVNQITGFFERRFVVLNWLTCIRLYTLGNIISRGVFIGHALLAQSHITIKTSKINNLFSKPFQKGEINTRII